MFKKMSRGLSFIMAIALILSLFVGVMAENEGDKVDEGANLVEADTTDDNVGNLLPTSMLSLFYNGAVKYETSKANVKINVMLDGQLQDSETKTIYKLGHQMTFTPAEGLIIQQVSCNNGCTYSGKLFTATSANAEMTVYLTSEDSGEDPTMPIGDKVSITYEYAKYNGVDVTVNVYVDEEKSPAATGMLTNVKRAANHMTLAINDPTKFGLSDKYVDGIDGKNCTYSGQVFTASTANGPFTLNVYLKTIPETSTEEYVRLGITRVAPLLKLPRDVSKLVTISWDGEVKHTIIHKGWSNGFLTYYNVPKNKEITINATMEGDFTSANWTCVNAYTQGILMNNSTEPVCTSNPLKLVINEKNITSLDLFLKGAYTNGDVPETGYTIEASWSEGGSISPEGVTVKKGEDAEFTIIPNEGYEIDTVTVDGNKVSVSGNSYTFKEVQANHTIHATFKSVTDPEPTEKFVPFGVYHYYGKDAVAEYDERSEVPKTVDSMKPLAGTTAKGYMVEKADFKFSGYSVWAQMETGKPMVELKAKDGKYDLNGALEVRVHIAYDKTQTPPVTPETGKLSVSKTASFSDEGLDPNQFVFQYKITAADKTLNGSFRYSHTQEGGINNANITFKKGVAELEVRGAGGTKTIEKLPAGDYTIVETGVRPSNENPPKQGSYTIKGLDFSGYSRVTTVNGSSSLSETVTVGKTQTASAAFVNTYTKTVTPPDPETQYTLSYDANGGENAPASVTKDKDTKVTLDEGKTVTHAKQGDINVVFAGWAEADTNEKIYTKDDIAPAYVTEVTLSGDKTVYAVWSLDVNGNGTPDVNETEYTLTYKDADVTLGTQQYLAGEKVTAIASPTKTDYRFDGWKPAVPETMPANDLTVVAQWTYTGGGQTPIDPPVFTTYNVNYNGNGNNGGAVPTDSNNYLLNSNVTVKGNVGGLTKTQAVFMGFSKSVNAVLTTQAAEDSAGIIASFNIAGDTTLYAVWAIDANNNGTPDYKEEPTIPDEPVPGNPEPENPGDNKPGDGDGGTDIKDDNVPGNDKPTDSGNDIKDDDVPLGDLPKTGDSNNPWHLVIIMAAAMAGMVYMVFGKKTRKN